MKRQICFRLTDCVMATLAVGAVCGASGGPPSRPAATRPAEALSVKQALLLVHVDSQAPGVVPLDDIAYGDTPAAKAYVEARSAWVHARRRLGDAVGRRFGPQALSGLRLKLPPLAELAVEAGRELRAMGDPFPRLIDGATVSERDNEATIGYPGVGGAVHARRVAGSWKIRFDDVSTGVERRGELPGKRIEPQSTVETYRRLARVDDALAHDVSAGKIKSAEEVGAEQKKREQSATADLLPDEYKPHPTADTQPANAQ